jgi:nitrite reductase/ring-hydroxylating ferredoxin subunit
MDPRDGAAASRFVRAIRLEALPVGACHALRVDGHSVALFRTDAGVFAVDNRCPHMGFPLDRGSVRDGVLTCHWHHARFDLRSGGTFDPWADDVRSFPVRVRDGEIWVDVAEHRDLSHHHLERLGDGLARDIPLVIAKSVIALTEHRDDGALGAFCAGLEFGVRHRRAGWGAGLTTLTCMMNLLPWLDRDDRARALYQGLAAVAEDCESAPPRFAVRPLPGGHVEGAALKRWFRSFVDVRDAEGAERCITTAVRTGASAADVADMLFAAATDHRYLSTGHVLDFTNKAFEALEHAGWRHAEATLASLARGYAGADRMEESNAWRNPVDLVAMLERAFESLPAAIETGRRATTPWRDCDALAAVVLGDDPQGIVDAMLAAVRDGCPPDELAGAVAYAAAMRIARFHTSNEFGDWDTAHHSFTFANAVQRALARAPSPELMRAAFDAAMSVYLDRFLNVPPAQLPTPTRPTRPLAELLAALPALLDRQQPVAEAADLVAEFLGAGGDGRSLIAALAGLLLREDRDFHTIQDFEAAVRQFARLGATPAGHQVVIATTRYLAAHAPTPRAQGQTYRIADRLHRGDRLFEST